METITVILDDGARHELPVDGAGRRGTLAEFLGAHGFPLNTRCGRRGLCKGCEVAVGNGTDSRTVKACETPVEGARVVEIPGRSRMEHRPQVGETFRIDIPAAHQPLFEARPGRADTAFAVDLGTTTVVVMLVDLETGDVIATAGGFNEQIRFGDNVLTRIDIGSDPGVRRQLQEAVTADTIAPLLLRACERAGRPPEQLAGGVVAGNTTMLHLLVGEDPRSLGVAPFTPVFIGGRRMTADQMAIRVPGMRRDLPVQLLPGIAAFIGADIVAGIYATGMLYDEKPSLLVDIGTNGEIVLQHEGRLTTCATAAGPAFEGGGLRCGTRARDGAISRLDLTLDPFRIEADVIGGKPLAAAGGVCGSAYIDFLAEAREAGLLTAAGRFEASAWDVIPGSHRIVDDDERAVRLAGASGKGDAMVSEVDVAVLLQAKAAIGAGIETLLRAAGTDARQVGRVYLAGGFGMHLDVRHAIAIGLLPGFTPDQVEVVGNTSLAGALLGLIDRGTLAEMEEIRTRAEVLELNVQEGFEDCYIDHLMLP